MNWTATIERYIAEGRTVSGGKGDNTLKNQEQAQADFTKTLMSSFQTQFAGQQSMLNFLNGKLQATINNPQGFGADALTAMRTGATEGTATSFAQSEQALHAAEAARGGNGLPSGVDAQLEAQDANAGAAANARSQQDITLENEQQKQTNYQNAINAELGVSGQDNPNGIANAANSGSDSVGNLGTAYKNSQNSQLLGALGGIAGGAAGVLSSGIL